MSDNLATNDLPPAFFMWKMFHSTITTLFKNLDFVESKLESLANTLLSSKECSDIFTSKYDMSLNVEQNKYLEHTYQSFTTWLLGRLFYLLSCEKFERIHDLIIKVQHKILIVLKLNQGNVFNTMIKEYNDALSSVNEYLRSIPEKELNSKNEPVVIKNFVTDRIAIKNEELELIPIFVELQSENSCYLLQKKLLKILTECSLLCIKSSWFEPTSKSILNNIIYCLENSKVETKIIVIEYFTELIRQSNFQTNESVVLKSHFRKLFCGLEELICGLKWNETNLNLEEQQKLDFVLNKLFNIINEYQIIFEDNNVLEKCRNMCGFFILYKLRQCNYNQNKSILLSSMILSKNILLYENIPYSETNFIVSYALMKKNCYDINVLLNYQIIEELKQHVRNNFVDALATSKTWKIIYEKSNSELDFYLNNKQKCIIDILYFIKSVMNTAETVYYTIQENYEENLQINFFPMEDLIIKIKKVINMYNINTSTNNQKNLDYIIDIFASIITFNHFTHFNIQNFKNMIEIILYPFWNAQGVLVNVKQLITNDFTEEIQVQKQMKTLNILAICFYNIENIEKPYINEIKNWIFAVFKFCAASKNVDILLQVSNDIKYLISIVKGSSSILYEILKQLLSNNNPYSLDIISKNLGIIICVLSGNYTISPNITEDCITYDVLCLQCDFKKNQNEIHRISDDKKISASRFIVQKNIVPFLDISLIINLLECNDNNVKINMIKQLPRFVKHINEFNTTAVINKWLKYIEDDDRNVRTNFISVIKPIFDNCQAEYVPTILDTFLKTLIALSEKYLCSGNAELLETLLDIIKEVGCLSHIDVLYTISKLIIFYLILCNTYLSLIAVNYLAQIAKSHNTTPNNIFNKYKTSFCQYIASMSVYAYLAMDYIVDRSLERIVLAFGFTMKDFITRNGHHLLSHYVPYFVKQKESVKVLNDIANLMVVDVSDLIVTNFSYIYTYVYLNEDDDTFRNCMRFIENITKENIFTMKKRSIRVIHNELLLHFHDKRDLVLKELYKLSLEETDSNSNKSTKSSEKIQQISNFLQPRFLGVLVYFDTKLVSKRVDDTMKIRILKSLPMIIQFMGTKYITPLRHKVLATLRTMLSLTEKQYLELTCDNWKVFIHCCEVEALGPLLSTIFVSVLPLLELFPRKINAIFKYLIVDNCEKLKDYIQDLFFLTETKVDNELKIIVKNTIAGDQNKSCKDKLRTFLKYINHENLEVRLHGLQFLEKYLKEKHIELEELILGNNGMDSVLVEVIEILIAGCREKDEQVRLACGKCIGELGAIEPSHFPRKYTQSDSNFTFFITDDSFVINALWELLRSFQMEKHTQNMNRFALAIQEILKEYGVSPDESAPKHNLWSQFPDNLQELMLPLLSSRYTVGIQHSEKISTNPIFGSHCGSTFNDWIFNWTSHLISLLKNEKRSLLQVCKPSLKYDNRTLMIFLPHILIHAILESSDSERNMIFNEFMAVLDLSNQKKLDPKQFKYQPLKTKNYVASNLVKKSDDTSKNNCIKVIFVLLDHIDRWLREYECQKCSKTVNPMSDPQYKIVHSFMKKFCKLKIAECNFLRGEYPRALMYLEQHVSGSGNKLRDNLGFFTRIYAELEEPDGVAGTMAIKQTEPSIEEMILAHNVSGQFQDAAACYERMAQEQTLKPEYLQDMVKCYLELDNPFTALNIASGAMENYPEYKTMLYESQSEPFWRLSKYENLAQLLTKPEMKQNNSWGVRMGQALLHFRNGNANGFQNEISNVQKILIEMLSITSLEEGVYRHNYPHIIKLHILNELQKAEEIVNKLKDITEKAMSEKLINELVEEWDVRLKVIQDSVRVVEPILRIRRIILEQAQFVLGRHSGNIKPTLDKHIAKYWLKSAEVARRTNIFQQAYIYILKAEQYKPMELFIEKAKLYWAKEDQDLAFSTLKRGIEEYFPDAAKFKDFEPAVRKTERKLCAEAKLLIATYNDETSNVDMDVNVTNYREAVEMYREWEKSQVCLAQYYDRVFSTMSDEDKDLKGGDMQIHIINGFGKSLQYGSTYIYQSMPRMLSIWLDYGTRIVESRATDDNTARESKKNTLFKMIKLIDAYLDRLPPYMFLSAFSQLVSRICHPVREVYIQIKSILIKLILKYPQQSMWMIMAVSKSAYAMRTKRCQEVLQDSRLKNSKVIKLICDFNRLAEKLIELCNKPISDGVSVTSVNTLIRTLPRLLQTKDFSQIMIPIQKLRKMILPNPESSDSQYNPFPNNLIYIAGIEDEIQVLQSLQRPRKITFRGSDGKKYIHMLKPKDDLRKDYRLMEFNDVVNLYLHREAESRQRRLCIRTYSVVPLNEECGIIEWVDNLVGLRPILIKIYKQRGMYLSARELKSMMCSIRDPLLRKREVFERQLLPKHPPVLSDWFRRTFPDAHCWYHARTAYVRTSAVVSMVGYVLGLGDRHGENILFDSTNGDTVHVDFNCLFNKGETFDWPERVPFRLTHNMVDAMGPLGVEGIFRRTCAVTLRVLRTHTDTLMSIVRPFVYDPLVSWPRNQLLKSDLAEAERTNEQAMEHIRNIELRLQGMIKSRGKSFSISLSCEGQANNLILEATNVDNLSQMYIGWGPFL